MAHFGEALGRVGDFSRGLWRYWRLGEPAPKSTVVVEKLLAYTNGRANDVLFRLLESKRKELDPRFDWEATSIVSDTGALDPGIADVVRTLKEDGFALLPFRLKQEEIQSMYELAQTCQLDTRTYGPLPSDSAPGTQTELPIAATGVSHGIDPQRPGASLYSVPRRLLLENQIMQRLLCDSYLLSVATRYLGVFPVVTRPDMWWDTDFVPGNLRPRPFHVDSGCLRWLKVGINLTETTFETPHFLYVRGSHNPNKTTRQLNKRLASRMSLSDEEVAGVCADRIVRVTAPAGSIMLADTRGIHKGELALKGHRLVVYFGLEGSAFNNTDQPIPMGNIGDELERAMNARPFSYQFFRAEN